jgi:hypothetical protein
VFVEFLFAATVTVLYLLDFRIQDPILSMQMG